MRLVPFSFSQQFGLYYYDPDIDTLYRTTYNKVRFDFLEDPALAGAFIISCLIFKIGYVYQWALWKWLVANLLICVATIFATNAYIRGAEKVIRKGEKIILARARKKDLERLLLVFDRMTYRYEHGIELKYVSLAMLFIWLFFGLVGIWEETVFWPVALGLLEMSVYGFVYTGYDKHRKACIKRIKKLLKNFGSVHNLDSQKCADRILEIYPAARSNYETHLIINGRLVIRAFALEILPEPFQKASLLGAQIIVPNGYFELVEDMWRYGDDDVYEAVCEVIKDYLASDREIWQQFCKTISDDSLHEIDTELELNN